MTNKEIEFCRLQVGDFFYYGFIQKLYVKCDAGNYNAVNLANGKAIYITDRMLVKPLDGEINLLQVLDWSDENGN